ncbi:hypothetical protein HOLleu_32050 [Holothuria leucospilota]|uniref:Uncharacterized protein n=1 Tax=Holothuria leucospilota TaxID=206669 RepID=A0A9Q1BIE6_HOLLE|nr:hypothetical protein HOLleu_32050 [Holothuria leucospilota]
MKETSSDDIFGITVSLTDQFSFVGMMILPIVLDKFQDFYGLQGGIFLFGGLNLNIMVAGVVMKGHIGRKKIHQPQHDHTESGSGFVVLLHQHWLVLVINPGIYLLCITALLHFFNVIAWALFLVSLGEESGLSQSNAVLLASCGGFGALFGRVWSIILFSLKVESPFQFFGIPALLQFVSLLGIVFIKDNFFLSMMMSFVAGMSFGEIGAGCSGLCALKTSKSDFRLALVMMFISLAVGNELGGGVSGKCIKEKYLKFCESLKCFESNLSIKTLNCNLRENVLYSYLLCLTAGCVYDIFGSSRSVFILMATVSLLITLVSALWNIWDNQRKA